MTPENAAIVRQNAYREDIEEYVKDMLPLYDINFAYAKAHLLADMKQAQGIHATKALRPISFEYHKKRASIWEKRIVFLEQM